MPRSGMSSLFTRRAVGVCSPKSHRPRSGVSQDTYNLSDLRLKHDLHCGFVDLGGSVSVSS